MTKDKKGFDTRAIHAGQKNDPVTGAVMTPIYATSTYAQESPGVHKGYEYSRTSNPTRKALEDCIFSLENGDQGFAFASGMAATSTILELLDSGDAELIELAKSDISISEDKIAHLEKDLKFMLLPKDDADDGSAYLESRPGAGGDEAAIFAADLFRMYSRLSERQGWKIRMVNTKTS